MTKRKKNLAAEHRAVRQEDSLEKEKEKEHNDTRAE